MSFLRHREIYQVDQLVLLVDFLLCADSLRLRERQAGRRPRPHRLDEFPDWLFLAGCPPALPASASPAAADCESAINRLQELFSAIRRYTLVSRGQLRASRVKRTKSRRRIKWPVLTRPQMAGFEVITEDKQSRIHPL